MGLDQYVHEVLPGVLDPEDILEAQLKSKIVKVTWMGPRDTDVEENMDESKLVKQNDDKYGQYTFLQWRKHNALFYVMRDIYRAVEGDPTATSNQCLIRLTPKILARPAVSCQIGQEGIDRMRIRMVEQGSVFVYTHDY
jgi:hypothetical protein